MELDKLLYSQDGIEETEKIWKEFERARRAERERQNEEREDEREQWWGWGGLLFGVTLALR